MKYKELVKEVEEYLRNISGKYNLLNDIYKDHILLVRDFALKLAKIYKADEEVVELASLLHDISYIETADHSIHEITGAERAKELLKDKISNEKLELISKCIRHHRGSKDYKRESIEEQIVACADAMSHITNCLNFMHPTLGEKQMSLEDSKKWIKNKVSRGWKKITLPEARKMVEKKYNAIMTLLEDY
jgi:putative nucleotidyltransferase with HDIG domain